MPARSLIPGLFITVYLLFNSCSTFTGKSFLPGIAGYNEAQRQVFILPKKLLEVSGIAHLGGDSIAAINDEKGELFLMKLGFDSFDKYQFKGKDDYEDLVRTDSMYYVAESDGDIIEISPPPAMDVNTYHFPFTDRKIEFESLAWYKKDRKLVLLSKDQRNKREGISAYSFDLAKKQFDSSVLFTIPLREIYLRLEDYSAECKPSGAAIHPITGKLFIVASIGKILLQCADSGKVEKIYKLNPTQFPQPEGITFANNGDMFISNEGLNGKATILKFPYSGHK